MTTYKMLRQRDNLGNNGYLFQAPSGQVYKFKMIGRVWKEQSEGWSARRTVIDARGEMLELGDRVARPLKLQEGEVFLPLSKTGRKLLLKALPE